MFHRHYPSVMKADAFRQRVSLAFQLLSQFWLFHLRSFQVHDLLAPVPREVMIAASWIFGRDFSSKGAFYLRLALTGLWGFNPKKGVTDAEFLHSMGRKMMPSLLCRSI